MRRLRLKWHVKQDSPVIKEEFKYKFVRSNAYYISSVLKFGLRKLTTKAFSFRYRFYSFHHTSFIAAHFLIQYA